MAREESSREDLLCEATALVERIELRPRSPDAASLTPIAVSQHIVAGFRAGGALSVFFGEDPVYQFNAVGELRRAYCDGLLYKAVRGRLVSLRRERTQDQVQLVRHGLNDSEQDDFLAAMARRLRGLSALLETGHFDVIGQISQCADVIGRVQTWLAEHHEFRVAARPNA